MKNQIDHLRMKGWKEHEIEHAIKIFKEAEEKKHPYIKILEKYSFWMNLFFIAIATIFFAALSTALMYLLGYFGYALTGLIALIIGALFTSTFEHLDKLEKYHHITTSITITIISLASYIFSSSITNRFVTETIKIESAAYSPWLLGIVYSIFFLIPYMYHIWHDNYINKKEK